MTLFHVFKACFLFLVIAATSLIFSAKAVQLPEEERRQGFAERNYSWPIANDRMIPNTPGWDNLMRRRIRQVEALQATPRTDKLDAWVCVMQQALLAPNFTQFGWAVVKAPDDLTVELQQALDAGIDKAWEEHDVAIVGYDESPLIVDMPELTDKALTRLHPYHEAWTGIPLKKQKAYGPRVYKNNSQLYMHLDKFETHIVSSIYHIGHSQDSQPWPLVIEDYQGVTQHIYLEAGDMLMYESAKCLHGRPIPFRGSWYSSLFLHFSPYDWPFEHQGWVSQYAIPDHWEQVRDYSEADKEEFGSQLTHLTVVDATIYEAGCPNKWCGTDSTSSWKGTAKKDVAVTSHGIEKVLHVAVAVDDVAGDEL